MTKRTNEIDGEDIAPVSDVWLLIPSLDDFLLDLFEFLTGFEFWWNFLVFLSCFGIFYLLLLKRSDVPRPVVLPAHIADAEPSEARRGIGSNDGGRDGEPEKPRGMLSSSRKNSPGSTSFNNLIDLKSKMN